MYIESKKKAEDYGISSTYQVMSEIGEATKHFLSDPKVCMISSNAQSPHLTLTACIS